MPKSIWDVRFSNVREGYAQDADGENWITIKGARVLLDGDGNVVGGAQGKFNGSNYKKAKAERDTRLSKTASTRPSYITKNSTAGMKDDDGRAIPKAAIPKTLEGAKDFFGKMAEGYKQKQDELNKLNRRPLYAYDSRSRNYENLQELASKWEKMTPDNVKNEVRDHGAGFTVTDYISAARDDMTGVGKWMAQDVLEKFSDHMKPEDVARYQEKIDSVDYWWKFK